jgi:DMSO/TMAO reductase YedYZ molybdopterin-dependent catalytic subunit
MVQVAGPAQAFPGSREPDQSFDPLDDRDGSSEALQRSSGQVIPWMDQPPPSPVPADFIGNLLVWEDLASKQTPADNFFYVNHYGTPGNLDASTWRVDVGGLVRRRRSLTMADIRDRPRHEVDFTLECSGNHGIGLDFAIGAIGHARWGGARLASLLEEAGISKTATEVVFWGVDRGEVTIRDNSGVVSGGTTGTAVPDGAGGLDLTITERFARSMSLEDALSPDNLLCYDMNGEPLPPEHGFPLRLIVPGWYGVANVKWLTRIEVTDRRHAGRFMSRDYVSIREEQRGGESFWTLASVGRSRLKSAPAKVTRFGRRYAVMGAAWGAPIAAVEVRVDDGPWRPARLYGHPGPRSLGAAWRFWTFDWGTPASGEHRITSRAFDALGNAQPAPDDPFLASRRTYWESNGHITRRVAVP